MIPTTIGLINSITLLLNLNAFCIKTHPTPITIDIANVGNIDIICCEVLYCVSRSTSAIFFVSFGIFALYKSKKA